MFHIVYTSPSNRGRLQSFCKNFNLIGKPIKNWNPTMWGVVLLCQYFDPCQVIFFVSVTGLFGWGLDMACLFAVVGIMKLMCMVAKEYLFSSWCTFLLSVINFIFSNISQHISIPFSIMNLTHLNRKVATLCSVSCILDPSGLSRLGHWW